MLQCLNFFVDDESHPMVEPHCTLTQMMSLSQAVFMCGLDFDAN